MWEGILRVSIPSREFGSSGYQNTLIAFGRIFVSIPSREFGSSGNGCFPKIYRIYNSVSIPSREFGSSGRHLTRLSACLHTSFNPFQGIWEFRRYSWRHLALGAGDSFNPFQGIWEFRPGSGPSKTAAPDPFQSLPGNLGVPAWMNPGTRMNA